MSSQAPGAYDEASYQTMLSELASLGMDAARLQTDHMLAFVAPTGRVLERAVITFDRIARAIRRTIALAHHLAHPPAPRRAREITIDQPGAAPEPLPLPPTIGRARPERLEAGERLDRFEPTELAEVADRPIHEVVASICRDLRIPHRAHWPAGSRPPPSDPAPAPPIRRSRFPSHRCGTERATHPAPAARMCTRAAPPRAPPR